MKFYKVTKQCNKCKGSCCKQLPGCYTPQDIKRLFPAKTVKKSVELALSTNKIAIDWWEGNKELYFLRPSTKDKMGIIIDPSYGGECIYLSEKGCKLSFSQRPYFCKTLEPKESGCDDHIKKGNCKLVAGKMWDKTKVLFLFIKNYEN